MKIVLKPGFFKNCVLLQFVFVAGFCKKRKPVFQKIGFA